VSGPERSHIEEYLKRIESVEELEKKVLEEIVSYLIYNRQRPDNCTLREMERQLKMPYTRLRRLVQSLVEDGVLVETSVGNVKILRVTDLDLVFRKGYATTANLTELIGIHNISFPNWLAINGVVMGEELFRTLPRGLFIPQSLITLVKKASELISRGSFDPDLEEKILKEHEKEWPEEEIEPRKKHLELSKKTYDVKEARERVKELQKWKEFYEMYGEMPLVYTPILRSNMLLPAGTPLSDRNIGEMMRHTKLPREAFTLLRFFPGTDIRSVQFRDVIFQLDPPSLDDLSEEKIQETLIEVIEKQQRFLMLLVGPLLRLLEEKGVEGTIAEWNRRVKQYNREYPDLHWAEEPGYTEEHILFEAIPLGMASLYTHIMGGSQKLAQEGRNMAFMIARAVERNYKGKEIEGCCLAEWYETIEKKS